MRLPACAAAALLLASTSALAGPPSGPHPRFLLGSATPALASNLAAGSPEIASAVRECDDQAGRELAALYAGTSWVEQMSACAVAWLASGDPARAAQAVTYWRALLDDQSSVGDGLGGEGAGNGGAYVVAADDGYAMRTYGVYAALGLDWLHDAPGVDDALRARAVHRLVAWSRWYERHGYLASLPTSNYFTGYFLAIWAAAVAIGTDDPAGARLWETAQALTRELVVPAMQGGAMVGGDWAEGWEYGQGASLGYALASAAAVESGESPFSDDFLRGLVKVHIYGLQPGAQAFFDSGDHQDHPVAPDALSVFAMLVALPDDPLAPFARRYLDDIGPDRDLLWVHALAEARAPGWPTADYRAAGWPLSYHARGTGVVLARSGWGPGDIWASFQAIGRLTDDHQHCDAGHFELVRGRDPLAISSADYGTLATWNNNTLLFDDGGANDDFSPNQGPFGRPARARVLHRSEVQVAACAQADFADSYRGEAGQSSVSLARREWVFVRPGLVIVNDRDATVAPSVTMTFAVHTRARPQLEGPRLAAFAGASRLEGLTLLPATGVTARLVSEPDPNAGSSAWTTNATYEPAFRAEETLRGRVAGSFLHVFEASASAPGASRVEATVSLQGEARVVHVAGRLARVVVLPDAAGGQGLPLPLSYEAPADAQADHVVFGLPGAGPYAVTVAEGAGVCAVSLAPGADARVASDDATAAFHLDGCSASTIAWPGLPPGPPGAGAESELVGPTGGCACEAGGSRDRAAPWPGPLALGALLFVRCRRRQPLR